MANEFDEFNETIGAMVEGLSPRNRFRALRVIAKKLKTKNQQRMRAQTTPDGVPFEPRSKRPYFKPETVAKFLYPSKSQGKPRLVYLSSWTLTDDTITGVDEKSGGKTKSFKRSKIIKWLPATKSAGDVTSEMQKRLETNRIKNRMFEKLRSNKFFKERVNSDSAEIGFFGSAGRIATEHHYGLNSEIKRRAKSKSIRMPKRELIGINSDDELEIIEEIERMIDYDAV